MRHEFRAISVLNQINTKFDWFDGNTIENKMLSCKYVEDVNVNIREKEFIIYRE